MHVDSQFCVKRMSFNMLTFCEDIEANPAFTVKLKEAEHFPD